MAKLVDAHGSGPCVARHGGSSPLMPTTSRARRGHKESQLLGFREDEKTGAMPQAGEVGSRKFCMAKLFVTESSYAHKVSEVRGGEKKANSVVAV